MFRLPWKSKTTPEPPAETAPKLPNSHACDEDGSWFAIIDAAELDMDSWSVEAVKDGRRVGVRVRARPGFQVQQRQLRPRARRRRPCAGLARGRRLRQ